MLDEALEIVAGLWSGEPFSFRGRHYALDEVAFLPRPVQRPRPPIWVGGDAQLSPDEVRDLRTRAGDRQWAIVLGGQRRADDWQAERKHVRAVEQAGADWWIEWVPPSEREAMREAVRRGPLR